MSSASTTLLLTTSVQTNSILSRPDDLMCIKDYLFKYIFEVQHTLLVLFATLYGEWRAQVNFICLNNVCIFDVVTLITATTTVVQSKYVPNSCSYMHCDVDFGTITHFRTFSANKIKLHRIYGANNV